ncbi:hypothetical protein Hamer_G012757 [Homarus americanus]|uniref:Secreted protein n=1 Tax=Homarus americanus TaxID=6706 RepID=A0A8J5JQ21_HOMAM|nr:hypothetical protein Hamer_G012757 [Homarus americanus]
MRATAYVTSLACILILLLCLTPSSGRPSMELEDTGSSHLRRVVRQTRFFKQRMFFAGGVRARRPSSGAVVRCRRCRRPRIRKG